MRNKLDKLKRIISSFKKLQDKLKEKISNLEINNINLRQSNFFIRSLTWGLISTSGFGLSFVISPNLDPLPPAIKSTGFFNSFLIS